MNVLKKLTKGTNKKFLSIFLLLAIVVVIGVLYNYNNQKSALYDNMSNLENPVVPKMNDMAPKMNDMVPKMNDMAPKKPLVNSGGVTPVSTTDDEQYLSVNGITSGKQPNNTCNSKPVMNPKELLPTDSNNEWSNIMPNNDLKNVGMLNAGHHIGINTVGSSLRNPNLQIRSEPIIPQSNVCPWNNTTIEPDKMRPALEIGSS